MRRFSSTVSDANTRRPCGTMLIPARATSWAASVRTSEPRKRIEPAVATGGRRPQIDRSSVVLPIPLRPRSASTSPSPTLSEMPLSTRAEA